MNKITKGYTQYLDNINSSHKYSFVIKHFQFRYLNISLAIGGVNAREV